MIDVSRLPLGERGCKNCKHTRLFCSACVRLGTECGQLDTLKAAIIAIVEDDIGIYPASWEGAYTERSDYMNGWNDACEAQAKKITEILDNLGIRVTDEVVVNPAAGTVGAGG